MSWTQTLLHWYDEKKVFLNPRDQDPYRVWLSEVIMQQTRVEQGTPILNDLSPLFSHPRIFGTSPGKKCSSCGRDWGTIHELNLLAIWMVEENKGEFPIIQRTFTAKRGGRYTASAISSICFNEAQAVVDGNVYRFVPLFWYRYTHRSFVRLSRIPSVGATTHGQLLSRRV